MKIQPDEVERLRKDYDNFATLDVEAFFEDGRGHEDVRTAAVEVVDGLLLASDLIPRHSLKSAPADNFFRSEFRECFLQFFVKLVGRVSGLDENENSFFLSVRRRVDFVQKTLQGHESRRFFGGQSCKIVKVYIICTSRFL